MQCCALFPRSSQSADVSFYNIKCSPLPVDGGARCKRTIPSPIRRLGYDSLRIKNPVVQFVSLRASAIQAHKSIGVSYTVQQRKKATVSKIQIKSLKCKSLVNGGRRKSFLVLDSVQCLAGRCEKKRMLTGSQKKQPN